MTLLLKGGTVVDPSQDIDQEKQDILIEDGVVADVGIIDPNSEWEILDLTGLVVVPGFIDMHVHFREPGREDRETVETGSRAAVAGGFTSVMCMPNTTPVNDNESVTRFLLSKAQEVDLANIHPCGAITKGSLGKELAEIGEMVSAGAVAISDDGNPVENNQVMRRALEYSRIFGIPVVDHCEDRALAAGGCIHEGVVSTRLGLPAMSRTAEEMDVVRDTILARVTGGHAHIAHVSTEESLEWIRIAKDKGVQVTCEVTPHHFILKDEDIGNYNTLYKMNPPLREERDVEAMLQGLADGTIDCIATDHAPHTTLEKDTTFTKAANGIIGLECAIPLAWNYLISSGLISISRLVELFSVNPSHILGLDRGSLAKGKIADVTVIDQTKKVTVDVATFQSKSRNCPFHGRTLGGVPVLTVVGGRVVYNQI